MTKHPKCAIPAGAAPKGTLSFGIYPDRAEKFMELALMQIVLTCLSGRDLTRQEIKGFKSLDGGLSALKELERRIHFQVAAVANFEPESALERWREATGADLELEVEEVAA